MFILAAVFSILSSYVMAIWPVQLDDQPQKRPRAKRVIFWIHHASAVVALVAGFTYLLRQALDGYIGTALAVWLICVYVLVRMPQIALDSAAQQRVDQGRRWARRGAILIPLGLVGLRVLDAGGPQIQFSSMVLLLWLGSVYVLLRTPWIVPDPIVQQRMDQRRRWGRRAVLGMPAGLVGLLVLNVGGRGLQIISILCIWLVCVYVLARNPSVAVDPRAQKQVDQRRRWARVGLVGIPFISAITIAVIRYESRPLDQAAILVVAAWLTGIYGSAYTGVRRLWTRRQGSRPGPWQRSEMLAFVSALILPVLTPIAVFMVSSPLVGQATIIVVGIYTLIGGHILRIVNQGCATAIAAGNASRLRRLYQKWFHRPTMLLILIIGGIAFYWGWVALEYQLAGVRYIWVARTGLIACAIVCFLWVVDQRVARYGTRRLYFKLVRAAEHGTLSMAILFIGSCCIIQYREHQRLATAGEFECVLEGPSLIDGIREADDEAINAGTAAVLEKGDVRSAIEWYDKSISDARQVDPPDRDPVNWVYRVLRGEDAEDPDLRAAKNNLGCLREAQKIGASSRKSMRSLERDNTQYTAIPISFRSYPDTQKECHSQDATQAEWPLSQHNQEKRRDIECVNGISVARNGVRIAIFCLPIESNEGSPNTLCPSLTKAKLHENPALAGRRDRLDLVICGIELNHMRVYVQYGKLEAQQEVGKSGYVTLTAEKRAECSHDAAIINDVSEAGVSSHITFFAVVALRKDFAQNIRIDQATSCQQYESGRLRCDVWSIP